MRTIIGQFVTIPQAQAAVHALLEHNYDRHDISFVAKQVTSDTALGEHTDAQAVGGAALGVLLGLGTLMIPGVGMLLAAGPIMVGLTGSATGVAHHDRHWLDGSLGASGVSDQFLRGYGQLLDRGGALVVMGTREVLADNITGILRDCSASRVDAFVRDPGLSSA